MKTDFLSVYFPVKLLNQKMTNSNEIKERRERLGLSQEALGAAANCRQQVIARLENGRTRTSKYRDQILDALEKLEAAPDQALPLQGIDSSLVRVVLETVTFALLGSEPKSKGLAEDLMQCLFDRRSLPPGLERESFVRASAHRFISKASQFGA